MNIDMSIKDTSAQDEIIVRKKGKTKWLKWCILLLLGLGFVYAFISMVLPILSGEKGVSAKQLNFATVIRGDFVRDVTVQGVIVAANSPTIFATSQGIVQYKVRAGDTVFKDQKLALIKSPELNNRLSQEYSRYVELELAVERQIIENKSILNQAKQTINVGQVILDTMTVKLERMRKSFDLDLIGQQQLEESESNYKTAKVNYDHSLLNLSLSEEKQSFELKTRKVQFERQQLVYKDLQRQVEDLTVRSQIDGLVGSVNFRDHDQVAANQALLTVIELGNYEVEVNIPEIYADELSPMLKAEILVNGTKLSGHITAISPEVREGQVKGRLRFENEMSSDLRQNQRVSAQIYIESKGNALKVKRGPYLESSGGRYVYVVKQEYAVKKKVTFGVRSASEIEVISGLQEGDILISSNVEEFAGAKKMYLFQ